MTLVNDTWVNNKAFQGRRGATDYQPYSIFNPGCLLDGPPEAGA